ncbi:MAG: hypothetical protein WEB06_20105 [Actinomycetota bacterium]
MDCPYCETTGDRQGVHRHLVEKHGDRVSTRVDPEHGDRFYRIACPQCDAPWERQIKPRSKDPTFLEEFDLEIRLVAFDMLLHHIRGEHSDEAPNGAAPGGG